MKLFSKKDSVCPEPRKFGPTHKKKNTYVVAANGLLARLDVFAMCKNTPLPVVSINGVIQQENGGWVSSKDFPNPAASQMRQVYKVLQPYMGTEKASTVVEYLDKNTGEPVVTLFPHNMLILNKINKCSYVHIECNDDQKCMCLPNLTEQDGAEFNKLNHASRQDLFSQIEMRQKFIRQYNQQKAK